MNPSEALQSSPALLEQLHALSIKKHFKAGSVLVEDNAIIQSIPIVTKGMLRVMRTEEDGRELLLYFIRAGESCVMSFLGGLHQERSKVRAIVEEDAEVLFLPIDKVSLFIKDYPAWLTYIFQLYHKRFEELLEIINAIAFKKVDQRLLDLLKKKAANAQSSILMITHEQLANDLGTARVVVSRLLKQLEEDGVVRLGRNKIELCN
jgi:CRP/FNR family transcriptional regulator